MQERNLLLCPWPWASPGTHGHRRVSGRGKAGGATDTAFPKCLSDISLTPPHSCHFFLLSTSLWADILLFTNLKKPKSPPTLNGTHPCKHLSATPLKIQVLLRSEGRCGLRERCLPGIYSLWPISQMGSPPHLVFSLVRVLRALSYFHSLPISWRKSLPLGLGVHCLRPPCVHICTGTSGGLVAGKGFLRCAFQNRPRDLFSWIQNLTRVVHIFLISNLRPGQMWLHD